MKRNPLFSMLLMSALLLIVTSCKKEIKIETSEENASKMSASNADASTASGSLRPGAAETQLLKEVRQATARYHSSDLAIKSGYEPDHHCVSSPAGGMGYHWVNPSLVDPVFDPLKPEVVLYAMGADGEMRLVALEYIVIDVGQPRPSFGNQLFDIGGTPVPVSHWSLHVWLYENNPTGMFKPFNPNITCP